MKLINYIKLYLFIFLKKTLFKFQLFESFYNEFLNQEKFLELIKKNSVKKILMNVMMLFINILNLLMYIPIRYQVLLYQKVLRILNIKKN